MLLALVTLGYGFVTILADFNKTHATNPKWTPHARFHVVWHMQLFWLRRACAGTTLAARSLRH